VNIPVHGKLTGWLLKKSKQQVALIQSFQSRNDWTETLLLSHMNDPSENANVMYSKPIRVCCLIDSLCSGKLEIFGIYHQTSGN
jgi:hypothetical protein